MLVMLDQNFLAHVIIQNILRSIFPIPPIFEPRMQSPSPNPTSRTRPAPFSYKDPGAWILYILFAIVFVGIVAAMVGSERDRARKAEDKAKLGKG